MLVYVSGRYSGNVDENIAAAAEVAVQLWERGHAVLCPHLNTAHFEKFCKATYEQYIAGDLDMISRCDAIVMLVGWEDSRGAVIERDYATDLGMPIYYYPDMPALHPTEIRCPEQVKGFREIVGRLYRVHLDKNADYSPANILATGEIGLATRLWDKTARLLNLLGVRFEIAKPGTLDVARVPKNEAIEDTYADAAVYAIIGLLLRRGVWGR
jgi:hypothetical protein